MSAVLAAALFLLFVLTGPAQAYPVNVYTENDPVQDDWTISGWWHEIGGIYWFPDDEDLISGYDYTSYVPCPSEYQGGTNWQIMIWNATPYSYSEVYYVADLETNLTNWDEKVGNAGLSDAWKAFRIDRVGENTPLVRELKNVGGQMQENYDGVWDPGEYWYFVIQDYSNSLPFPNPILPCAFSSLGIASLSSGDGLSTGSILAIPEPATLSLLGLGALAMIRRRGHK